MTVDQVAWDDQRHVLSLAGLTLAALAPTVPRLAGDEGLPAVASDRVIGTSVVNNQHVDRRVWLNGGRAHRHAGQIGHPIARSVEAGEDWMWCFIDSTMVEAAP